MANKEWEPPEYDNLALKKAIPSFKVDLQTTQKQYNRAKTSNLTPRHWKLASILKIGTLLALSATKAAIAFA